VTVAALRKHKNRCPDCGPALAAIRNDLTEIGAVVALGRLCKDGKSTVGRLLPSSVREFVWRADAALATGRRP
jgi:hypothetical protein